METLSARAREWLEDEVALSICRAIDRGVDRRIIALFFRVDLEYVDDLSRCIGDKYDALH